MIRICHVLIPLGFKIQGTNGLWMNDGDTIYVEGQSKPHRWDESDEWFKNMITRCGVHWKQPPER